MIKFKCQYCKRCGITYSGSGSYCSDCVTAIMRGGRERLSSIERRTEASWERIIDMAGGRESLELSTQRIEDEAWKRVQDRRRRNPPAVIRDFIDNIPNKVVSERASDRRYWDAAPGQYAKAQKKIRETERKNEKTVPKRKIQWE